MLRVHFFGSLRLFYNQEPLKFVALPKTLPLFAYLLLNGNKPIGRAPLAYTLWPDVNEAEARSNLRRHLYELRRVLPPAPEKLPWLLTEGNHVQWNPQAEYWLDVKAFVQANNTPACLVEATQLYTADLLPELYEDWVFFERERLRNLFFDKLVTLISHHRGLADRSAAILFAQQLLQHDSLREDVVRDLMLLRHESGDRAGALQEYRRFEQRLRQELEVAPMVETSALYDTIARQTQLPNAPEPPPPSQARSTTFPTATVPAPSTANGTNSPPAFNFAQRTANEQDKPTFLPPNNLITHLTSFIGRGDEVATVSNLLARPERPIRLLTLTGSGGSGKTRLALEVGERLLQTHSMPFPDGVFAIMLSALSDHTLLLSTIAGTLNLKDQGNRPAAETLKSWLQGKKLLLILDNFEQISAATPLLLELLSAAPQLAMLVTSRARLQIYGEQEYFVQPLPLPDIEALPAIEKLADYDAINLFLTRSRAVNLNFRLTHENAKAIAELCVRLDGLPLALELAAARSKLFSPEAMLTRLSDALTFLTDRSQRSDIRHQTLRATLDWSYQLLAENERKLLARLAVFARRFTLEAAESVCAIAGDIAVLDGLDLLIDNSLVRQIEVAGEIRFIMLATVRDYAWAQLSESEIAILQEQRSLWYADLAQKVQTGLTGANQRQWLERLSSDDDNLRAVLGWLLEGSRTPQQVRRAVQMLADLSRYWEMCGRLQEGYRWMEQALSLCASILPEDRARLLNVAASYAQMLGNLNIARLHQEAALAIVRTVNNPRLQGVTLHTHGLAAGRAGDFQRADEILSECLALYRRTPEITSADLGSLLNNLAIVATRLGDFPRTIVLLTESLELSRQRGDKLSMANVLGNLGNLARQQGELATARHYHHDSLQLRQEIAHHTGALISLQNVADLLFALQDTHAALRLFGAAETLRRHYNAPLTGHMLSDFEANVASLRTNLDTNCFAQTWAAGEALSLLEAIQFALAVTA